MSNCRTVEEARAWMSTRGIRQLGTEHLTQKRMPYVCGDYHPDKSVPGYCEGCTQSGDQHGYPDDAFKAVEVK